MTQTTYTYLFKRYPGELDKGIDVTCVHVFTCLSYPGEFGKGSDVSCVNVFTCLSAIQVSWVKTSMSRVSMYLPV